MCCPNESSRIAGICTDPQVGLLAPPGDVVFGRIRFTLRGESLEIESFINCKRAWSSSSNVKPRFAPQGGCNLLTMQNLISRNGYCLQSYKTFAQRLPGNKQNILLRIYLKPSPWRRTPRCADKDLRQLLLKYVTACRYFSSMFIGSPPRFPYIISFVVRVDARSGNQEL